MAEYNGGSNWNPTSQTNKDDFAAIKSRYIIPSPKKESAI